MRILLLNPNTTQAVTGLLLAAGQPAAAAGTELIPLTAARGVPYIATRAEAQIGGAVALEMLAEHHRRADGAIIAAFGDPGLMGARELFDFPVVGMAEAAMLTACMLGRRFAILTFAVALEPWYQECGDYNGMAGRCAGVFCLDEPFRDIDSVAAEKSSKLIALSERAIAAGADVCILGGAPLAGLAAQIAGDARLPLVDGVAAAVKQAELLAALRPRKAQAGTFRRPGPKAMVGISPEMSRLFSG